MKRQSIQNDRIVQGCGRRRFLQAALATGVVAQSVQATSGQEAAESREIWRFETGDGVRSSPTVVDGTVYFGSRDGYVYAVDAGTGAEIWTFDTEGSVLSSANVIDETVYIGNGVAGGGHLYALDASDGSEQWTFEADGWVHSSPTVVDGTAFFGSVDEHIYAVDISDGSEQWRVTVDDWIHDVGVTVTDDTVYVGSYDDYLYALDADTGDEQWRFDTGGNVNSAPVVAEGDILIEEYRLDAETGEERSDEFGSTIETQTVWDGTAYGQGTLSNYVEEIALDSQSDEGVFDDAGSLGDRLFEAEDSVESIPTVTDDVVFACDDAGTIYSIDLDERDSLNEATERWRFETDARINSSPIVVDGVLYVGNADGDLYGIETDVDGSSEDSLVQFGTLGHHHEWADADSQEITPGVPASVYDSGATDDGSDGFGPGFGAGSAVAALAGAGYLLKRGQSETKTK